jgi:hypothetical protein
MAEAQTLLAELGFGEYEARAYLALLGHEPVNGYELAKLSGIPRGNVYAVLEKLENRGAVVHMDTPAGVRYAALPVSELLAGLERRYKDTLAAAADQLSRVAPAPGGGDVWNLDGYELLLEHARSVVSEARERLLVAVWPPEARALASELNAAQGRGLAIETLCLAGCPQECGACRGNIHRHRLSEDLDTRALVIVPDDGANLASDFLAMEIIPGNIDAPVQAARGIRTRQRQLIDLAASYIRHSIALAALLVDLGPRLADLVSNDTRRALAQLVQSGKRGAWLLGLRRLLSRGDDSLSAST